MNVKFLNNILDKIKEFGGKLSKKNKKIIAIALGAVIIFSGIVAVVLNNKPYDTLFTGLNEQESAEIIGKLQESGVDYRYEKDGTILVPKEQEQKLKAQLVFEGYPKSGFTYDLFKENINMMTTDFEKNNYKLFELQNRMGATISLFDGVKDAKVTIALGEDRKYVLDSKNTFDAKASVVVIMKDGGSPSVDQVKGIQRLVSKSIPNLNIDDVVVLDGNGNDVSVNEDNTQFGANKLKIEFEKNIDTTIESKILKLLAPIFGAENVRVAVKSTVDIDKKVREITNYATPDPEEKKGIPSKESTDQEIVKDGQKAGGVPGTESNSDIPTYSQIKTDGSESYIKNQNSTDYYVNQLKEQSQADAGTVKDITVSVAINGKKLEVLKVDELRDLIAKASGIPKDLQKDKIAVVVAPFYKSNNGVVSGSTNEFNKNWIIIGTIAFVSLLLLSILIIVVLRKRKRKKNKLAQKPIVDLLRNTNVEPPKEEVNELIKINNEKGMELKNKIREFSEGNPEISANLLKVWLKGGGK